MKNKMSASMFQKEQVIESIRQSFVKLNPRMMIKNPIMFTVEVVTVIMLVVTLLSLFTPEYGTFGYNLCVFLILFVTLLFANFAEAIAEARGKAQADSLRKTREETPAKLVIGDKVQTVSSSKLKKGDVFVCEAGDTIPADVAIPTTTRRSPLSARSATLLCILSLMAWSSANDFIGIVLSVGILCLTEMK